MLRNVDLSAEITCLARQETAPLEGNDFKQTASTCEQSLEQDHPVIFFDGVCGLCNRFVDFVLIRDKQDIFRFAPLQGETARRQWTETDNESLKTVVLVDRGGEWRRSAAVVRVLWRLGGFWKVIAALLWIIPRPVRDFGYNQVASWRYRLFGRREACRMPSPAEKERLLP